MTIGRDHPPDPTYLQNPRPATRERGQLSARSDGSSRSMSPGQCVVGGSDKRGEVGFWGRARTKRACLLGDRASDGQSGAGSPKRHARFGPCFDSHPDDHVVTHLAVGLTWWVRSYASHDTEHAIRRCGRHAPSSLSASLGHRGPPSRGVRRSRLLHKSKSRSLEGRK